MEAVRTSDPLPRSLKWAPTALAQWKVLFTLGLKVWRLHRYGDKPSQVSLNDLVPCIDRSLKDTTVGSTSSVGNKGINLAKVLDDGIDKGLDSLPVTNVEFVGLDLGSVSLGELLNVLVGAVWARRVAGNMLEMFIEFRETLGGSRSTRRT